MSSKWPFIGAISLEGYATIIILLALPAVLDRSTLWQFSMAIIVVAAVPTAALGALLLIRRIARVVAILAAIWMIFLAWSWLSSGPWVLGLFSVCLAVLLVAVAIALPRHAA